MSKEYTLGRTERLKQRKVIGQLFKEGKHFSVFPFRVYYMFPVQPSVPLQAGFNASARNFKKAVDRNRIKRVTREAYRLQKKDLYDLLSTKKMSLAIFLIYTDRQLPVFGAVKDRVRIIIQKLITITNEMDSQDS